MVMSKKEIVSGQERKDGISMKVYDLTGPIQDGMWGYEPPFPAFHLKPLPQPEWVATRVYCEIFEGIHSQTGTYLETPAHF